jgi:hypothetical protein
LCCSTWLTDFRSVNTSAARYQQLSWIHKTSRTMRKIKMLELWLDTYMDAWKIWFRNKLVTEKGDAICQKQDILKVWCGLLTICQLACSKIDRQEIVAENKLKQSFFVRRLCDWAIVEPEKT